MLVDATHPFAARISRHAAAAAAAAGAAAAGAAPTRAGPRDRATAGTGSRTRRPPRALLPALGERVFLATGRGDLAVFARLDLWFLLRAVDPPPPPLPARCRWCLDRGPFPVDAERALLRRAPDRRAGHPGQRRHGAAAKLLAARELDAPRRPARPPAAAPGDAAVATVAEALAWLDLASASRVGTAERSRAVSNSARTPSSRTGRRDVNSSSTSQRGGLEGGRVAGRGGQGGAAGVGGERREPHLHRHPRRRPALGLHVRGHLPGQLGHPGPHLVPAR